MCKNCDLVQFFTVVLDNVKMWRSANGLRNMSNIVPVKKSIHDIYSWYLYNPTPWSLTTPQNNVNSQDDVTVSYTHILIYMPYTINSIFKIYFLFS